MLLSEAERFGWIDQLTEAARARVPEPHLMPLDISDYLLRKVLDGGRLSIDDTDHLERAQFYLTEIDIDLDTFGVAKPGSLRLRLSSTAPTRPPGADLHQRGGFSHPDRGVRYNIFVGDRTERRWRTRQVKRTVGAEARFRLPRDAPVPRLGAHLRWRIAGVSRT